MTDHDPVFDRAAAYEEADGLVCYRASTLGSCLGALARARLGVTPSGPGEMMQGRFQEGHDWEARVIAAGLGEDWVLVTERDHLALHGKVVVDQAGLQVETEIAWGKRKDGGGGKVVRCHPDGIAVHRATGEKRVVEAKLLSEEFGGEKIKAVQTRGMLGLGSNYAWQASVEMLSTGLPLLYVIGLKQVEGEGDARRVVGIGDVEVIAFDEPCYGLADVKARVLEVEGYVARGELPACPVPFDFPCGYWAEHLAVEKQDIEDDKLGFLVESYGRAMDSKARHEAEAAAIKDDIADRLIEIHVDSGRIGGWDVAHVAARPGNVSWSKWAAKVKKDHPDVKVDEEQFRGAEVAGSIRMTKVKD